MNCLRVQHMCAYTFVCVCPTLSFPHTLASYSYPCSFTPHPNHQRHPQSHFHSQHDHIVIMGDLNYRMDRTKSAMEGIEMSILTNVAVAANIEKECLGGDEGWITRRYNLLRCPRDAKFPSETERTMLHRAGDDRHCLWRFLNCFKFLL